MNPCPLTGTEVRSSPIMTTGQVDDDVSNGMISSNSDAVGHRVSVAPLSKTIR